MHRYRTHTCGELRRDHVGEAVRLSGWVHRKRDHGNLLFVDLRDQYGTTQCAIETDDPGFAAVERIRPESVVTVEGELVSRDADTVNPEIDTGVHVMMALKAGAKLSGSVAVRFAVLTHDLGKATTPKWILPGHRGHEERSVGLLEDLCGRLPVPRRFRELAVAVARYHGNVHRAAELRPATIYRLIEAVDALRRPQRFEDFLLACEADARGRLGLEERPYPQAGILREALAAARSVSTEDAGGRVSGPALGMRLRQLRIKAIRGAVGRQSAES